MDKIGMVGFTIIIFEARDDACGSTGIAPPFLYVN
jgi:hypothetical protein